MTLVGGPELTMTEFRMPRDRRAPVSAARLSRRRTIACCRRLSKSVSNKDWVCCSCRLWGCRRGPASGGGLWVADGKCGDGGANIAFASGPPADGVDGIDPKLEVALAAARLDVRRPMSLSAVASAKGEEKGRRHGGPPPRARCQHLPLWQALGGAAHLWRGD